MVPRITTAYFQGTVLIPNITTGNSVLDTARASDLNYYTTLYEEEYLKYLLGDDLFDQYEAAVDALPPLGVLSAKWQALVDAIYFTKNSKYLSPAAYYIWFFYMKFNQSYTTNSGQAIPNKENAVNTEAWNKMVMNWNVMCELTDVIREWLDDNAATYDTYSKPSPDYLVRINRIGY